MATNMADNGVFNTTLDIRAALYPDKAVPIDARSLFSSYDEASNAAYEAVHAGEKGLYHFGQQVCVVTETGVNWYVINIGENEKGVLVPLGTSPHIGANGHWFIGDLDTGVTARGPQGLPGKDGKDGEPGVKGDPGKDGIASPVNGFYTVGMDDDGTVYAYPSADGAVPNLNYDAVTGELYYLTDEDDRVVIGNVRGPRGFKGDPGKDGEPGKGIDVPLGKGPAANTVQQVGNTAGAIAFKITGCGLTSGDIGYYDLNTTENIRAGMKYVACTSEMNAVGGTIKAVHSNKVEVDGYRNVGLNSNKDNPDTGDVYNYLIIVEDPENPDFVPGSIGDTEIGYGAVALGDGSVVLAKNGFSTAKDGIVLGKYGSVGGKDTKAGHCARADGDNTRALGSCSSTDGSNTEATGFGAHAGGVDTKAPAYASDATGLGTKTERQAQSVCGQYNASDPNAYFIVGGGSDDNNRRNAFSAGFHNGEAFIKLQSTYMSRSQFGTLVSFVQNIGSYAKKSDIPTAAAIIKELSERISIEADGTVYLITED